MNTPNASPAELLLAQDPMSWPGFLILGCAVLLISALAIIAPRRRRRMMMLTDVLEDQPHTSSEGTPPQN